jgi:hypothetical protein
VGQGAENRPQPHGFAADSAVFRHDLSAGPTVETIRDYEYIAYLHEYAHDAYINNAVAAAQTERITK